MVLSLFAGWRSKAQHQKDGGDGGSSKCARSAICLLTNIGQVNAAGRPYAAPGDAVINFSCKTATHLKIRIVRLGVDYRF
jgi:hypothetical protein